MTTITDNAALVTTATDRLNKSLTKKSLADFVKARTRRSLLLVDCSSSMTFRIRSGERRIDALRKVVENLRETHATPTAAFMGADVRLVEDVPDPRGNTPMDKAITFGSEQGANHLVIVTDGEPSDEYATLAAARAFDGTIDTFYIGDGNDAGSRFAAELARMTGGVAHLNDLGAPKQLAGEIRLCLGDGSSL